MNVLDRVSVSFIMPWDLVHECGAIRVVASDERWDTRVRKTVASCHREAITVSFNYEQLFDTPATVGRMAAAVLQSIGVSDTDIPAPSSIEYTNSLNPFRN